MPPYVPHSSRITLSNRTTVFHMFMNQKNFLTSLRLRVWQMPLDSVGNTQSLLGGEKRCASRSRITAAKQIVAPVLFNSARDF
jgi:hypothetical protein